MFRYWFFVFEFVLCFRTARIGVRDCRVQAYCQVVFNSEFYLCEAVVADHLCYVKLR